MHDAGETNNQLFQVSTFLRDVGQEFPQRLQAVPVQVKNGPLADRLRSDGRAVRALLRENQQENQIAPLLVGGWE